MKKIIVLFSICLFIANAWSQGSLTTLPSGGNKKASISEQVGLTQVTIHYDRPGVKGREGKIWGQLVYKGFSDLGFGSSKSSPWRAGANENTTIEFSRDVTIEGKPLPAGKYGLFMAYDPLQTILIFSKNSGSWGSYYYNEQEDALRVSIKPIVLDKSVEWLKYEFTDETETGATVALMWEQLAIPFRIETNYVQDQLNVFRQELRTEKGFEWQGWQQAASWCLQHNVNLEQALLWADSATAKTFGGNEQFSTWSTKAQLLEKLNRATEAAEIMKKALPLAGMNDMHMYGRTLLQQKKVIEAIEVFKANYKKYPTEFTTMMGMARGLSAQGNYKEALKYVQQALPIATEINTRNNLQAMIEKLKAGKDIN